LGEKSRKKKNWGKPLNASRQGGIELIEQRVLPGSELSPQSVGRSEVGGGGGGAKRKRMQTFNRHTQREFLFQNMKTD